TYPVRRSRSTSRGRSCGPRIRSCRCSRTSPWWSGSSATTAVSSGASTATGRSSRTCTTSCSGSSTRSRSYNAWRRPPRRGPRRRAPAAELAQGAAHHLFGDLHGVGGGAFAEVVAHFPQPEAAAEQVLADAPDEHRVPSDDVGRCREAVVRRIVDDLH